MNKKIGIFNKTYKQKIKHDYSKNNNNLLKNKRKLIRANYIDKDNEIYYAGANVSSEQGANLNTLIYSTDGEKWIGLGNDIFNQICFMVKFNGTIWVAVGQNKLNDKLYGTIAYSENGQDWIAKENPLKLKDGTTISEDIYEIVSLEFNDDYWLAVGENIILKSEDGINWENVPHPLLNGIFVSFVKFFDNKWIIYGGGSGDDNVGYSNIAWANNDHLLNWNIVKYMSKSPNTLLYANNKWFVGGFPDGNGGILHYIDDITNVQNINDWIPILQNEQVGKYSSNVQKVDLEMINSINYSNGMYILAGQASKTSNIMYSYDGITWEYSNCPNTILNIGYFVEYQNNVWVVSNNDGSINNDYVVSKNGIDWIPKNTNIIPKGTIYNIELGKGEFVKTGFFDIKDRIVSYEDFSYEVQDRKIIDIITRVPSQIEYKKKIKVPVEKTITILKDVSYNEVVDFSCCKLRTYQKKHWIIAGAGGGVFDDEPNPSSFITSTMDDAGNIQVPNSWELQSIETGLFNKYIKKIIKKDNFILLFGNYQDNEDPVVSLDHSIAYSENYKTFSPTSIPENLSECKTIENTSWTTVAEEHEIVGLDNLKLIIDTRDDCVNNSIFVQDSSQFPRMWCQPQPHPGKASYSSCNIISIDNGTMWDGNAPDIFVYSENFFAAISRIQYPNTGNTESVIIYSKDGKTWGNFPITFPLPGNIQNYDPSAGDDVLYGSLIHQKIKYINSEPYEDNKWVIFGANSITSSSFSNMAWVESKLSSFTDTSNWRIIQGGFDFITDITYHDKYYFMTGETCSATPPILLSMLGTCSIKGCATIDPILLQKANSHQSLWMPILYQTDFKLIKTNVVYFDSVSNLWYVGGTVMDVTDLTQSPLLRSKKATPSGGKADWELVDLHTELGGIKITSIGNIKRLDDGHLWIMSDYVNDEYRAAISEDGATWKSVGNPLELKLKLVYNIVTDIEYLEYEEKEYYTTDCSKVEIKWKQVPEQATITVYEEKEVTEKKQIIIDKTTQAQDYTTMTKKIKYIKLKNKPLCCKEISGNLYADNFAKTNYTIKNDPLKQGACYPNKPPTNQVTNKNGIRNDMYSDSYEQYLQRRGKKISQNKFNFLSNKSVKKNMYPKANQSGSQKIILDFNDKTKTKIIETPDCAPDCAESCKKLYPKECKPYSVCDVKNNMGMAVYKPNNRKFSTQGAVSGGSRINRLKYQTIIASQNNSKTNNTVKGNNVAGKHPISMYKSSYPIYKQNNQPCQKNKKKWFGLLKKCD